MYNLPLVGAGLKKLINQQSKDNVHTHGWSDFVKVVITTTAILLFNSEEGVKYFLILKGSGSSKGDLLTSIFLGYGLLVISLFFDGLMGLKEKIINHEVHHNPEYKEYKKCLSWEYMRLFSFYTILFGVVGVLYQLAFNDLIGTIKVYLSSKELIFDILSYSFLSAVGQIFLFQFLEKYGPLTLSIITGVRKILTIAISIIYFGKAISIIKVVSLILGTTVIGWEVFEKASKGHNKTH